LCVDTWVIAGVHALQFGVVLVVICINDVTFTLLLTLLLLLLIKMLTAASQTMMTVTTEFFLTKFSYRVFSYKFGLRQKYDQISGGNYLIHEVLQLIITSKLH